MPEDKKEEERKKAGLPFLKMGAAKEKTATPPIPSLKGGNAVTQPRIKILGQSLSIVDRLKQFKKKDLAFMLSGLGVLFMAPLAEHFLLSPDSADQGAFKEGWGFREAGGFGKGDSPFERGIHGLAPGGIPGGSGEIITPLNVRDPSALVMGPGATQQPPAGAPPASDKKGSDWKDVLAEAGKEGAKGGMKSAGLPVPTPKLGQSALRGLSAVSGGGAAPSMKLDPISASNVPNRAADSSSLANVRPTQGYKGAAGPRGLSNASGGLEDLKKAAAKAGADFNRNSSASTSLEQAASRAMPSGGGFGGSGPGSGGSDKAGGGNQSKDSKSTGESLEFLRMKQEQEKAIDLKWKLKEKAAMRWPNLQDKLLEEAIMTPFKTLTKGIADKIEAWGGGKTGIIICTKVDPKGNPMSGQYLQMPANTPPCHRVGAKKGDDATGFCVGSDGNVYTARRETLAGILCSPKPTTEAGDGGSETGAAGSGGAFGAAAAEAGGAAGGSKASLSQMCAQLKNPEPIPGLKEDKTISGSRDKLRKIAADLAAAESALSGNQDALKNCGEGTVALTPWAGPAVPELLDQAYKSLFQAIWFMEKTVGEGHQATRHILLGVIEPSSKGVLEALGSQNWTGVESNWQKIKSLEPEQAQIDGRLKAAQEKYQAISAQNLLALADQSLTRAETLLSQIETIRAQAEGQLGSMTFSELDKNPKWKEFLEKHKVQLQAGQIKTMLAWIHAHNRRINDYYRKVWQAEFNAVSNTGIVTQVKDNTFKSVRGGGELSLRDGNGFIPQTQMILGGLENALAYASNPEQIKKAYEDAKTAFGSASEKAQKVHAALATSQAETNKALEGFKGELEKGRAYK
ncbi:MAG: hypothetical protein HY549_10740 [Elusimicrobia bacterium]|nr:hypothetical protein [Elusimicrobiota bacterium]